MLITEILNRLNCTEEEVINLKHEFHYKTRERIVEHEVLLYFEDKDGEELIKTYLKRKEEKRINDAKVAVEKEKKFQEYLKTARNDHPLVTDERCFRLNWWPDVTPRCFEDLD